MKRLMIILFGLMLWVGSVAQPPLDIREEKREQIEAQRVAFITKHLNLSPEEAQQFWPVYNAYKEKQRQIHEESRPDKSLNEMSDKEVEQLLNQMIERKEKELELEREYLSKFRDILSDRKVAKLQVAERRFNAEVIKRLSEHLRQRREQMQRE